MYSRAHKKQANLKNTTLGQDSKNQYQSSFFIDLNTVYVYSS